MKKCFILSMLLCLMGNVAKAQFSSSSKVYAYARAGEDIKYAWIDLIVFDYNCIHFLRNNYIQIRDMYKKDPTFLSFFKTDRGEYKVSDYSGHYKYDYDSSNSTSVRTTYARFIKGGEPNIWHGGVTKDKYYYLSFSKDKSSMIEWRSDDDGKTYKTLVELSEFAPKSQNKDFLYE